MAGQRAAQAEVSPGVLFDLQDLVVAYRNVVALQGISLQVAEGEKVAIIGSSGAGKTTLLYKLYQLRAAESAFIHQQFALVPQLTVFHNIYIGRLDQNPLLRNVRNLIKPRDVNVREIEPIVATLGLRDKIFVRVGELSGGQQQRVAIGRAMYRGSGILLADEPVASVDVNQGESILKLIMDTDKTVVASLHSVNFALRFARRIVGLRGGRILFDLPVGHVTDKMLAELYRPC
jgi:phosphonate transport system ATP-binding protein